MEKSYDLIVVGGGPAGLMAAITAAHAGKSVALINKDAELGGAGINTGTVPSKTLRETALALAGLKSRDLYGVDLSLRREATVSDLLRHERTVRESFHSMLADQLTSKKTHVYTGVGTFLDAHTIRISRDSNCDQRSNTGEASTIHGEVILIATGSSPLRSDLFPYNQPGIYDSDTILNLGVLPSKLAVIGAGVIGSEYACTFAALGIEVHVIDGREVLLPFLDGELSSALVEAISKRGVQFHWNERVEKCTFQGHNDFNIELTSGKKLSAEAILVAAGRSSNTADLNLEAIGVTTSERGLIKVDQHYRTNIANIYAAGDVIGFPALASASMEQARRAINFAFKLNNNAGEENQEYMNLIPNGVYTIPETSMVGATEESLQKAGVEYVVGRAQYKNNARGCIIGDTDGFLKLIYGKKDRKLLGVHIMGEQAIELVHIGLMAMIANATAAIFENACFNSPTLAWMYKHATIAAFRNDGAET